MQIVRRLELPITKTDEIYSFSEILKILRAHNPEFVNAALDTFDRDTIEKLKKVLTTKNFVSPTSNTMEVRRNVVVKKRTPQENQIFNAPFGFNNSSMSPAKNNNSMMSE